MLELNVNIKNNETSYPIIIKNDDISNIKNTIEDCKYFRTKIPAETAVSAGSESQPFDYSSENRFNSAISSAQRDSSGVSRIRGMSSKRESRAMYRKHSIPNTPSPSGA